MDEYYKNNDNNNYIVKKKILISLLIAFIAVLCVNVILFSIFSARLTEQFNNAVHNINELVEEQSPVFDTVIDSKINEKLEAIVLENYKREYNLPDNYIGIGVIIANEMSSILELEVSAKFNFPYDNQTTSSQASAFILNEEGYVLTNAHCVTFEDGIWEYVGGLWGNTYRKVGSEIREYSTIRANFKGSSQGYDMDIVSYNIDKDLAILKFKNAPELLTPVTFGNSSLVNLGEEVAAIGNAQGLGASLTTGVISNTPQPYNNVEVIQTDTVINPGNSGGPLFNIYGEVIGVVSFKIIHSEANEGLGFAIASQSVMEYIEEVKTEKTISINYNVIE